MRERVLDAAAHQMNLQGAASIDLSSVSSAVGLTRNAFYYYFKSRRELIYHSYLRANRELAKDLAQANAKKLSACEQLRTLITANLAEGRRERTVLHDLKVLEPAEQDAGAARGRAVSDRERGAVHVQRPGRVPALLQRA